MTIRPEDTQGHPSVTWPRAHNTHLQINSATDAPLNCISTFSWPGEACILVLCMHSRARKHRLRKLITT